MKYFGFLVKGCLFLSTFVWRSSRAIYAFSLFPIGVLSATTTIKSCILHLIRGLWLSRPPVRRRYTSLDIFPWVGGKYGILCTDFIPDILVSSSLIRSTIFSIPSPNDRSWPNPPSILTFLAKCDIGAYDRVPKVEDANGWYTRSRELIYHALETLWGQEYAANLPLFAYLVLCPFCPGILSQYRT